MTFNTQTTLDKNRYFLENHLCIWRSRYLALEKKYADMYKINYALLQKLRKV